MTAIDRTDAEQAENQAAADEALSLTAVQPDELLSRYISGIVEKSLEAVKRQGGDMAAQMGLIRRLLTAVSEAGAAALPPEDDPECAPWDAPDVLVGSVRSEAQYAHCLRRGYYYVPAAYIQRDDPPVHYVAMCHAAYTADPGIRWYGEVLRTARVRRQAIPFPLTRNNPGDWYYAYVVKSWKPLQDAVAIRDASVYQPRRTNRFLLTHAPLTCALFGIGSAAEYRTFAALYSAFCAPNATIPPAPVRVDAELFLRFTDKTATLTDTADRTRLTVEADAVRQAPGQTIQRVAEALRRGAQTTDEQTDEM